ncbi:Hypothetical protein, putative [Bodo saltans]|uniref:Uncharacterized protein n=1 Tax=Bodo saltans TaxID=75058 RepID=A0A0S4JAP5_BODSA|nr:Hypothetical protein, putative [Bodo saltans]|eukprot:CUG87071.1 Hypothetical protein, putative [Bodo saltans]
MTQVSWGHYLNIHKYFADRCKLGLTLDDIFQEPVCVTEKLDGSNLGIHISALPPVTSGEGSGEPVATARHFSIVALMGRNSVLWAPSPAIATAKTGAAPTAVPNTKYGNAGALEGLPTAMLAFASSIATTLNVDEMIIYGEAYRGEGQKKASWHPFGYKVPSVAVSPSDAGTEMSEVDVASDSDSEDGSGLWRKFNLTTAVHQLFTAHQNVPVFNTTCNAAALPSLASLPCRNAYADALVLHSQNTHVVCPPLLLFSGGSLGAAIEALAPMLTAPIARTFEGTFIVCEVRGGGFKWKTGLHEEQKGIPNAEELVEMALEGYQAKVAKVEAYEDGCDERLNCKMQWMRSTIPLGCGFTDPKCAALYATLYNVFRARPTFAPAPTAKKSAAAALLLLPNQPLQRKQSRLKRTSWPHFLESCLKPPLTSKRCPRSFVARLWIPLCLLWLLKCA